MRQLIQTYTNMTTSSYWADNHDTFLIFVEESAQLNNDNKIILIQVTGEEGEEVMEDACDDDGWDVGDEDLELPEELAPVSGM